MVILYIFITLTVITLFMLYGWVKVSQLEESAASKEDGEQVVNVYGRQYGLQVRTKNAKASESKPQ